jgi:predicted RNase H-like HicB family nuclease
MEVIVKEGDPKSDRAEGSINRRRRMRSALLSSRREVPMRYTVVLHRTEEGISVSVPGLPGCWSEGDTEDEALENIRDAIREYLAARDDLTRDAETREVEVAV